MLAPCCFSIKYVYMQTCKILLLFLFIWPQWLIAQQTEIIPPSPEAASVFKFAEVPVNAYSGLANVSIPVFEIKAGKLSIPVNLSYHGRGVRVEEVAPRVGIGWTLNYGGMISRQTRGKYDDLYPGYLTRDFYKNIFTSNSVAAAEYSTYINDGTDFDPDMFMFDFPGGSGKFQFDQRDQTILQQKYSDTKITPIWDLDEGLAGWIVVDNAGTKYYFGISKDQLRKARDCDHTVESYSFEFMGTLASIGSNQDRRFNTWHLMEIETVSKEVVEFYYDLEEPVYYRRQYDKNLQPGAASFFGRVSGNQYQISEIRFRNGKVKFIKSATERKDLKNAYALDRIELIDKRDSILKTFSFKYNYPATVNDGNQLSYLKNIDTSAAHRLFLKSVQEKGRGGDTLPPYSFVYDDQPLPNRFSNSQDNWGFYNGKSNGEFLTFFNYSSGSINRQVDTVKSKAGLLKRIYYPTGGYVNFIYEHNVGVPPVFMDKLLFATNNPREEVPIIESFLKHSSYWQTDKYVHEFRVGPTVKGNVYLEFTLLFPNADPDIINYSVTLEGEGRDMLLYPGGPWNINLQPGLYRVIVEPPFNHNPLDPQNGFFMKIEWDEEKYINPDGESPASTLLYAAGKRVKRIEYRNADESLASYKEYRYVNPATGKSSGVINGLPNFYFIKPVGAAITTDKYGSIPGSPLTTLQGNGIGYSHVTEFSGDTLNNIGKTEYQFTTIEDGGKFYKPPYTPPVDNEWLRGKPIRTDVYEKTGLTYTLKKSTVNKYLYAGYEDVEAIFMSPFRHIDSNATYRKNRNLFYLPLLIYTKDTLAPYNYEPYYQTGGAMDLYSTTETQYESNGATLVKETRLNYDYANHYNLSESKILQSKGDTVIMKTTYPTSNAGPNAVVQKLIDQNRLATPLSEKTIVKSKANGSILSDVTKTTTYADWGSNLVEPSIISTSINSGQPKTELQMISYDARANPTEMIAADGVRQAYIWGYNAEYPVARITGSTYSTAKSFINESMLSNAHQYTDHQIRAELNKIRTGLSSTNAMISTVTYQPLIGIKSKVNERGQKSLYEYDKFGRLELIRDNDSNIIKRIGYYYVPTSGGSTVVYNSVAKSGTFTRNNCTGGSGSTVTYNVLAGAHTSTISQADADK